ncbi:helix-turn-helix domain-containing protein [Fusobacterium simiae]|uniref:winged helix-turn-helix transcriptional regulator n=1 Tax=Fusobacterium simiae TaxID=855 RepID=UPI0020C2AB3A|nr:helix-turn-helix domain-containing protein [Fusobacterium simiae]MDC7956345.1 helix-turn-helix domain-containing protein [Fusobacterium simiae]
MSKTLIADEMCPMDLGINILSGKWKLKILWNIQRKKVIRFNELQKLLGTITTKTLTNQLRELEEQKIIKRNIYPEVLPKVEYSLTEIGESIIPVLKMLCEWGKEYQRLIKNE